MTFVYHHQSLPQETEIPGFLHDTFKAALLTLMGAPIAITITIPSSFLNFTAVSR